MSKSTSNILKKLKGLGGIIETPTAADQPMTPTSKGKGGRKRKADAVDGDDEDVTPTNKGSKRGKRAKTPDATGVESTHCPY